jgi:hypothetical protein
MSENMSVRCPACGHEHLYASPSHPCVCGAPAAPPLDRNAAATPVTHRVWDEEWVAVCCAACGRRNQWPRPELGCPCGTALRIPVSEAPAVVHARSEAVCPAPRHACQPVEIRTVRDAVMAVALYLRRLGYRDIRRADQRPPSGIGLAARGVLAQVDPTLRPASPRDVECLWLTAMTESVGCVYFSLAGYTDTARSRANDLSIPLFVLDPTGTPRAVNGLADELDATGA